MGPRDIFVSCLSEVWEELDKPVKKRIEKILGTSSSLIPNWEVVYFSTTTLEKLKIIDVLKKNNKWINAGVTL